MKKKLSRKEEIELMLAVIALPIAYATIKEYGKWWKPKDFSVLKVKLKQEYETL